MCLYDIYQYVVFINNVYAANLYTIIESMFYCHIDSL